MSIKSVTYASQLTTVENINIGPGAPVAVAHKGMDTVLKNLNAASTPKAQAISTFNLPLVSNTATVDLTNLPGTTGTINGSTCGAANTATAVQMCKIAAPIGNVNPITVGPSVSNGYKGAGDGFLFVANSAVTFAPGDELLWMGKAPTISNTVKDLTLTGTGSSDSLNFEFILG